ncbi:MAG TPA: TetR/AcrR family transcriptional regulator [Solirubrobacterales bacterium]
MQDPGAAIVIPARDIRDRLTDAATRLATDRGYEALRAEAIAEAAGLSIEDFRRHFDGESQCLLAAYDRFIERLLDHVEEASAAVDSWPEKVKVTIEAGFQFVCELEPVARMFAVESVRIGPAAIHRRLRSIDRAARVLERGRSIYPTTEGMPSTTERTLVAGVVAIAAQHLLAEEASDLSRIEVEAVEMVLRPYVGPAEARSVAARSPGADRDPAERATTRRVLTGEAGSESA